MRNYELNEIDNYISSYDVISDNHLREFIYFKFPNRNERYYNYSLMELYKNNILYKFDTNKFKSCRNRYKYDLKVNLDRKILHDLERINPPIVISYYNTDLFNYFTSLQIINNIHIIETYSYTKQAVLKVLLDNGVFAVYEEDYEVMKKYITLTEVYIIKTINEDSPIVRKITHEHTSRTIVTVPKIEKLLIDVFTDQMYKTILGSEMDNIYKTVLSKFQINQITLFRYAKKKYCYEKLLDYLKYIGYNKEIGEFEWY